ncbi:MAG: rubrerythrin family protein [Candidatus Zixiibacteriota bacterium]
MSKTLDNLRTAFAGESQAFIRYTYFATAARKEGFHYIAKILEETAQNELRHAKDELILLHGIGDTVANLKEAIGGEHLETTAMYPSFAKEADAEMDDAAARLFHEIGQVEMHHRVRFQKLLQLIETGMVYRRDQPIKWKCSVCGYIHDGKEPPSSCPCCHHPREFYEPASLDI